MKKLIKNGVIVTHEKTFASDVLIDGEIIRAVGENIPAGSDTEVINASGMYVMPGGVDVHTHLNLALGDRHVSDGFYAGTMAAAFGGTTTIVDHPEAGPHGCSLHHQPEYYKKMLAGEAVVDYGIHGVFQRVDRNILNEIPKLIADGIPSMKIYTTYDNMLTFDDISQVAGVMRENGGLTAFHAEDDRQIKELREKFGREGHLEPIYHAKSRPDMAEETAIKNIIKAADGAPVYIVHLTSSRGLAVIREGQAKGLPVMAETCPQYLVLDDSLYLKQDGLKYIMAPPLRTQEDTNALWEGLVDGSISVVATDHCSFSYADKKKYGSDDFRLVPGGIPGVETRLPLLFSEGVVKERISLNRFVELVSVNPAKLMGLYPKKGCIRADADADLVIWDKNLTKKIKAEELHQKCDYTPYEGMKVTGWPAMTMLRGKLLTDRERFIGIRGRGMFIHRKPFKPEADI